MKVLAVTVSVALGVTTAANADLFVDWGTDAFGSAILPGQIIDSEFATAGMHVSAVNFTQGHPNLAVIFDSNNPTGGDFDLRTPGYHQSNQSINYGNLLIIQENGADNGNGFINTDPDDEGGQPAGYLNFALEFQSDALEITLVDIEEHGGTIEFLLKGLVVDSIDIPAVGDNSVQTLTYGGLDGRSTLYDEFRVNFAGSAAIAEMHIGEIPVPGALATLMVGLCATRRRRTA